MGRYGGTAEASKTDDGVGVEITFPGEVENLTLQGGHTELIVIWDEPNDDGGLAIEAYKVYRGPAAELLNYHDEVSAGELSYTDTDVENGLTYYYSVAAVNGFGEGSQATPVSAMAEWSHWDHNGDGRLDLVDFAAFSSKWMWQAWWYE